MGNTFDRAHGLHIFSGGFCFSRWVKAVLEGSSTIEISEEDWAVVNGVETAFFGLDDSDRLADERLTQKDAAAAPLDLAVAADPSHVVVGGIFGLTQPTGIDARRRLIVLRRWFKAKRLMRTLLVEDPAEVVKTLLLSPLIGRRRGRGLFLQRSVHSLVTTVLLWPSRVDPLRPHPRLGQLHREPAETARSRRRERRTI